MPLTTEQARAAGKLGGRPKGAVSEETRKAQLFKQHLINEMLEAKGEIIAALIAKSKTGDVSAIKESLDRVLGKAKQDVDLTSGGEKIGMGLILTQLESET